MKGRTVPNEAGHTEVCKHCEVPRTYVGTHGVCNVCMNNPVLRRLYSTNVENCSTQEELDSMVESQRRTMPTKEYKFKPKNGYRQTQSQPVKAVGKIALTTYVYLHPDSSPEAIIVAQQTAILAFLQDEPDATPKLISESICLHLWVVRNRLHEIDPDTYPVPKPPTRKEPSLASKRLGASFAS